MPKGRTKTVKTTKKKINPLVEHIADFSDIEYESDDGLELVDAHSTKKRDDACEDETDKMWMYKNPGNEELSDDEEVTDEDLWGEEGKAESSSQSEPVSGVAAISAGKVTQTVSKCPDIDKYMSSAVWFHDISERKEMTQDEARYVELMIIELSKFYFGNLDKIRPSGKCLDAVKNIYRNIQEAGLCTES